MSREVVIRCNGCGIAKRESNHWFVVALSREKGTCWLMTADAARDFSIISPSVELIDLCGQLCAMRAIGDFMSSAYPPAASSEDIAKAIIKDAIIPAGYKHTAWCAQVCSGGVDACDCKTETVYGSWDDYPDYPASSKAN